MKFLITLAILVLSACAPMGEDATLASTQSNGVYVKSDTSARALCTLFHACSAPGESCTFVANGVAMCFQEGTEGQYLGCRKGQLILEESNPARAGCY